MNIDSNTLQNFLVQALPILVLCGGAVLCLLIDAIWPHKMSTIVYTVGIVSLIVSFLFAWNAWNSNIQALKPPQLDFPILVIDQLTLFLMLMVILVGIFSLLNALGYIQIHQTLTSEFCSLMLFSIVGMVFLFASNHLLINFIGLETMSLAVYVLVGSQRKSLKSNEAAIKYFVMGGVASAIMLYGIALFYGSFGTFHLVKISVAQVAPDMEFLRNISLALVLVGLFFKIAVVPFHFWAPDVYEGAPSPVTGFMATGVKIAAFGFVIRFLTLMNFDIPKIQTLLTVLVSLSLIIASLLAITQTNVKRMLAYSSITHAGFLLLGILAGFQDGQYLKEHSDVLIFYLVGYTFMSLGAFAILSLMSKEKSEATDLGDLRGLAQKHPALAAMFALFLISMAGIPPTVGFAAKYNVIVLAVKNGHIGMAVLAVISSAIAVYYYLRPIVAMYFGDKEDNQVIDDIPLTILGTVAFCAVLVLGVGIFPDTFIQFSQIAVSIFR